MKKNFEEKIRSQRPLMDIDEPDDSLIWEGISRDLNKRKTLRSNFLWKAAAMLIFVTASSYFVYREFLSPRQNIYNITLSDIAPDYAVQVSQFQAQINERWNAFEKVKPQNTGQLKFFFNELDQLDQMYRQYQEDYQQVGNNERLIRAMLDNYEKRVRILDRMLNEIQKQKDNEERQKQTDI